MNYFLSYWTQFQPCRMLEFLMSMIAHNWLELITVKKSVSGSTFPQ